MNKHVEYDAKLGTALSAAPRGSSTSGVWIVPFVVIGAIFWGLVIWFAVASFAPSDATAQQSVNQLVSQINTI